MSDDAAARVAVIREHAETLRMMRPSLASLSDPNLAAAALAVGAAVQSLRAYLLQQPQQEEPRTYRPQSCKVCGSFRQDHACYVPAAARQQAAPPAPVPDPLSVRCPWCLSAAGNPCRNPSSLPAVVPRVHPHASRVALAKEPRTDA